MDPQGAPFDREIEIALHLIVVEGVPETTDQYFLVVVAQALERLAQGEGLGRGLRVRGVQQLVVIGELQRVADRLVEGALALQLAVTPQEIEGSVLGDLEEPGIELPP